MYTAADMAEAWFQGWYHATNGKWGLPEPDANPYGRFNEEADQFEAWPDDD